MRLFYTFFLLTFFQLVTAQNNTDNKIKMLVSGRIVDFETKAAIEFAQIRVSFFNGFSSETAITDKNGYFQLKVMFDIPPTNYPVEITRENYNTVSGYIFLKNGANHNFFMTKKGLLNAKDTAKSNEIPILISKKDSIIPSVTQTPEKVTLLAKAPKNNFVFLIDISSSMNEEGKLQLMKDAIKYLVEQYRDDDQVAIITYASNTQIALGTTFASEKATIFDAIDKIKAAGVTNGGKGLDIAYDMAKKHFINGGNNKIVLCTDGLFGKDEKEKKKMNKTIQNGLISNVRLSILSFGNDQGMVKTNLDGMALQGKGKHLHIKSLEEAKSAVIDLAKN